MSTSESNASLPSGDFPLGSEEDLRLIIESFKEAGVELEGSLVVGSTPLSVMDASDTIHDLFRPGALLANVDVSAYRTEGGTTEVTVAFDLDQLAEHYRDVVAKGIGRDRQLSDLLSGVPVEVTDRIDAAKVNPRLAGHLMATAADHLVWRLRLRIQDTLFPIREHRSTLVWKGSVDPSSAVNSPIVPLLPFATAIRLDLPAMENPHA